MGSRRQAKANTQAQMAVLCRQDNISTKFIKASPGGMAVLLTRLINKSIMLHAFGKMLSWYQFRSPLRVPHCLIFVQSLFYLFFLKF